MKHITIMFTSILLLPSVMSGQATEQAHSGSPSVSSDGNIIAFISARDESRGPRRFQIYVTDRTTGQTRLVSRALDGAGGNLDSFNPLVSPDGRHVVFASHASDLVPGDDNDARDIFLHDLESGSTMAISSALIGESTGAASSIDPVITRNGDFVIFQSFASDLTDLPTAGTLNVFRYEISNKALQLISLPLESASESEFDTWSPSTSDDGSRIVFARDRSVFLWTQGNQTLDEVPMSNANGGFTQPYNTAISGDGTTVFIEGPWLADSGTDASRAIARVTLETGELALIASELDLTGPYGPYSGRHGIELYPATTGNTLAALLHDVPNQHAVYWNETLPAPRQIGEDHVVTDITRDPTDGSLVFSGRPVADINPSEETPLQTHLYHYDPLTDELKELPIGGEESGSYQTDGLVMTDDGTLFFHTEKNGVVTGDDNGAFDVYSLSPDTGVADWISALIVQAQPVLNLIIGDSGGAILTWTAEVGRSYLVEFKNAVNDPEWSVLMAAAEADTSTMTATDNEPGEQRFYRVVERTE